MTKRLNTSKGITLIALVITIIVLLILAGVAISMLSGENGILKKAAEAKTKTDNAQKEEVTTLIDYELDSHFILNNSKYKCRNGFITGVTIEEVETENENILRTKDTVKDLQKELPDGYSLSLKYNLVTGEDENVNENDNLMTGMVVTKDKEEVARVVVYGDIQCDGILSNGNVKGSLIKACAAGTMQFHEFQKQAMNVIHDLYIDDKDADYMSEYYLKIIEGKELKNQGIYASKIKTPTKISDNEIINSLGICEQDDFEKIYDEENEIEYYNMNLNKEYTYKELYSKIKEVDSSYKVQIRVEGKRVGQTNEDLVVSGAEIDITIPLIVNNGAVPENSNIYLNVK